MSEPSEAALAFAGKLQEACMLDVNLYDLLQDDVARLLDAFAAQAVAAERARIVGELREKLIRSRELLEMGHEFASEYVTAFSTAIAIAEGES